MDGEKQGRARKTLGMTAAALIGFLFLALALFYFISFPRQTSPRGTLDKMMDAIVRDDPEALSACLDMDGGISVVADWMESSSAEALAGLYARYSPSLVLDNVDYMMDGLKSVRVSTVTTDWKRSYNDAQIVSALIQCTASSGERFTLDLMNLNFTYQDGVWYLKG